jgi:hypothetical protein
MPESVPVAEVDDEDGSLWSDSGISESETRRRAPLG